MLRALVLISVLGAPPTERAHDVVAAALRAVDGDRGVAAVSAWRARLASDLSDSAAILGLASVARLTYDFESAERGYARLIPRTRTASPSEWTLYAMLGRAEAMVLHAPLDSAGDALDAVATAAHRLRHARAEAEAEIMLAFARFRSSGPGEGLRAIDRGVHDHRRSRRAPSARASLDLEALARAPATVSRCVLGSPCLHSWLRHAQRQGTDALSDAQSPLASE